MRPLRRALQSADELAHLGGGVLPERALKAMLGAGLLGLECALCLHRVAPRPRRTDWQVGLSMPAEAIDGLIELLLGSRPGRPGGWLRVTFDDGYADAADYVRTRAARFAQVQFLFFVCPEKTERRAGFRWDFAEEALKAGASRRDAEAILSAPVELDGENARAELRMLADDPAYRLATLDEVRALRALPNVTLGNHTNVHLPAAKLDDAAVAEDYRRSTADFTRLFGPQWHLALPYGTPRHHFGPKHVAMLRALGAFDVWTTEARPFAPEELRPGAVLPRFPVNGSRTVHELAGWIAARALDFRLRGKKRA